MFEFASATSTIGSSSGCGSSFVLHAEKTVSRLNDVDREFQVLLQTVKNNIAIRHAEKYALRAVIHEAQSIVHSLYKLEENTNRINRDVIGE